MELDGIEREAMVDSNPGKMGIDEEPEKKQVGEESNKSGILENLITNLTSPRASNPIDVDFFDAADVEHQAQNLNDHPGAADRVIDKLVSHLPDISIPENAAPTSDEASLLIHSVIHD